MSEKTSSAPELREEVDMEGSVRPAASSDVPSLVELMKAFYTEAEYPLGGDVATRIFRTLLSNPSLGRVWLIEAGGAPVGYVVLTLSFSMEFGGLRGFVDDFFVLASKRRKGLGAAALASVRQACDEIGVRALLVETGPAGHPARRLYARAGFTETGRVFLSQTLAAPVHEL